MEIEIVMRISVIDSSDKCTFHILQIENTILQPQAKEQLSHFGQHDQMTNNVPFLVTYAHYVLYV